MNSATVKLQIPLDKSLRDQVEKHARAQGFSSIQDFTRVMYSTVVRDKLQISLAPRDAVSPEAETRYAKQLAAYERDKRAGKTNSFVTSHEFIADLTDK